MERQLKANVNHRCASASSMETSSRYPIFQISFIKHHNCFQRPLDSFVFRPDEPEGSDQSSYIKRQPAFGSEKIEYQSVFEHITTGHWRDHPHNYVLLALISILVVVAVAVLVLVLVKLYLRVVKGNQSLGISLLIGIIILYSTAFFFVFDPTDSVCRLRVILHGLGYTICFGKIYFYIFQY